MPYELPAIKRRYFCYALRYGLIIINLLFVYWRIKRINIPPAPCENDNSVHHERANLAVMITDMVLNVISVSAAHIKNRKLLKISLIGNIITVTVFTLYSLSMICYYFCLLYIQYQISVKWMHIKPFLKNIGVVASGASVEILISFAMLLLYNEIEKLNTYIVYYQFRFANTVTEAKCTMEYTGPNEIANEEEDIKTIIKNTIPDYSFNNVIETICTIECEDQDKITGEKKEEQYTTDKAVVVIEKEADVIKKKKTCDYSFNNVTEVKCIIQCDNQNEITVEEKVEENTLDKIVKDVDMGLEAIHK